MKDLLKILAVVFVVFFVIRFCRANFSDMKANETYISTADKHIKIELTEEEKHNIDDLGNISSSNHIAYLYVNDDVYEGTYNMFVSNTFKKELWVAFDDQGLCHETLEVNPGAWLREEFYVKRNKIVVKDIKDYFTINSIFKENNTFIRKTWWNTWGKNVVIILGLLFGIWLFKDVPKMLKDKEMMKELKNDFKENLKESMNDIAEDLKDI